MDVIRSILTARLPSVDGCEIASYPEELILSIPEDEESARSVLSQSLEISQLARELGKTLIIKQGDRLLSKWPPNQVLIAHPGKPAPPLIAELPDPSRKIAIVRMSDNVALYTTSKLDKDSRQACQIGQDLSRWHLPEELHRLRVNLENHGYIKGFQYRAFNGDRQLKTYFVDAWLTEWRGVPVRVVEKVGESD